MLEAPQRGSIEVGDPVYYRDEEVGKVVSTGLYDDARSVGIVVAIASRYARRRELKAGSSPSLSRASAARIFARDLQAGPCRPASSKSG